MNAMDKLLILFVSATLAACVDTVPRHRVDVPPVYTTPSHVSTPPAPMKKPAPAPLTPPAPPR